MNENKNRKKKLSNKIKTQTAARIRVFGFYMWARTNFWFSCLALWQRITHTATLPSLLLFTQARQQGGRVRWLVRFVSLRYCATSRKEAAL